MDEKINLGTNEESSCLRMFTNITYTIVTFSLIIIFVLIGFILQVVSWILFWPLYIIGRNKAGGRTGRLFSDIPALIWKGSLALAYFLNPFWRLEVIQDLPNNYKPKRTIMMINHNSSADGWIVLAACFPYAICAKYAYKKDLENIPIAGWGVKMSDELPISFLKGFDGWKVDSESVKAMMAKALDWLNLNKPLVVFPEGTRSRDGRLQKFKPGFFRLAIDNDVEILPVMFYGSKKIWPSSFTCSPGTVSVQFGKPIFHNGTDTTEEFVERVQTQMIEMQCDYLGKKPSELQPLLEFRKSRGDQLF